MTEQNPTSPEPSGQPNPEQPAPQQPSAQPYQQPYGQPYAAQYSPQYAPAYAPTAPTNSMAVVTLIAGIAGLTLLPFVASIVAVITGPIAKRQIAQTHEQGSGMVTAGVVMGWIGVAIGALSILAVIVFFVFFAAAVGTSYSY